MLRLIQYFGKYQSAKGAFGGLPFWARGIIFILAIPGLILILLSTVAFLVSVLALFLLTIPVYRLFRGVLGSSGSPDNEQFVPAEEFHEVMSQFVQIESGLVDGQEPTGRKTVVSTETSVATSSEMPSVLSTAKSSGRVISAVVVESTVSDELGSGRLQEEKIKARRSIDVKIVE